MQALSECVQQLITLLALPWRGSAWSAAASFGGEARDVVETAGHPLGVSRVAVAAGL